jgi:intracellular septation protein
MKLLFDLFPVILFFIVFKKFGIFAATATAMVATVAQTLWVKYRHGKVDAMLWVSFAIITVFGGATLLLHDESFIKWKPTILYWIFACVLLGSNFLFKKNLMFSLLHEKLVLPTRVFFATLGVLNLYVAFNYSTDAWVNFKLFGVTGLIMVFVLLQAAALSKYMEEDKEKN